MRMSFLVLGAVLALGAAASTAAEFDLQGHRGTRGNAPENTIAAFEKALAIGVTTLEMDAAITADGVVVVSHDPALHPALTRDASGQWLKGRGPLIKSLTFAQLQAYDVGRPIFRGLFVDNDPNKRMMAIAGFNSDMSEFWEWSDTGYAPVAANNEAYKLGINLFMYGITH